MNSSDNSFTIRDNNSQIISIIPEKWAEALVIISRIQGFSGIDAYVLSLIKDRLEMFVDTRDELGESFKKYMQNVEGLEESKSEKDYVNVKIDSDLVERLEKLEERKKQQSEENENENLK